MSRKLGPYQRANCILLNGCENVLTVQTGLLFEISFYVIYDYI